MLARKTGSPIRSRVSEFDIDPDVFRNNDIHLHVPAGAIPKDGPSAGITMFIALLSLLTSVKVRADVAMTGEITLRGNVLPVGGIKEKVLAAHRSGIKRVILPERNRKDLVDVSPDIQNELEFFFVDHVSKLPPLVLEAQEEASAEAASDGNRGSVRSSGPPLSSSRTAATASLSTLVSVTPLPA